MVVRSGEVWRAGTIYGRECGGVYECVCGLDRLRKTF